MPEISRFLGIVIKMFVNDHNPPHFHAIYGDVEALVEIRGLSVFAGRLPPRVLGLVLEWAALHQRGTARRLEPAQSHNPLVRIEPL